MNFGIIRLYLHRACGREDIVETCAVNVEMVKVSDDLERKIASRHIMAEVMMVALYVQGVNFGL